MSTRKGFLLVGLGSTLLIIAALLFTFSPMRLQTAHANASAITFANNNWACLDVACTTKVQAGDAQPDYECAEFVARSLAFAGYMPGLGSLSPQSDYYKYNPHLGNGRVYDLLLVTPTSGYYTLQDYLSDSRFATDIHQNLSSAVVGDVVIFRDANNVAQHTAIISVATSSASSTAVDAHNNARHNYDLDNYFSEFTGAWYILHLE